MTLVDNIWPQFFPSYRRHHWSMKCNRMKRMIIECVGLRWHLNAIRFSLHQSMYCCALELCSFSHTNIAMTNTYGHKYMEDWSKVYAIDLLLQRVLIRKKKGANVLAEVYESRVITAERPTKLLLEIAESMLTPNKKIHIMYNLNIYTNR